MYILDGCYDPSLRNIEIPGQVPRLTELVKEDIRIQWSTRLELHSHPVTVVRATGAEPMHLRARNPCMTYNLWRVVSEENGSVDLKFLSLTYFLSSPLSSCQ